MEYDADFHRDFMRRTLSILRTYQGDYDATLLINVLLGLLIVPRERSFDSIPPEPVEKKWGLSADSVSNFGECQRCREPFAKDIRSLVKGMRKAVAHFSVVPQHADGECVGFAFADRSGFKAQLSLSEMEESITKLATFLEDAAANQQSRRAQSGRRHHPICACP